MKKEIARLWLLVALAGFSWFAVSRAGAHDLWLVPEEKTTAGKAVLRANVGMDFPKSVHAPDPAAFQRRLLIRPDGKEGLLEAAGKESQSGLLRFEANKPGVYVAAVETRPKLITLPAEAFNAYLVADGMPHIYRLRAKEKTLQQPGRERYSKYCKALIRVGSGAGGDPCRAAGLLLELVPLGDPFALKVGATLPLRVVFRGRPLADANLGWQFPGDGEVARGYVRTDARGQALVPISQAGLMTLRLTHMTRPKTAEYEWESFWATLTFRIPE